MFDEIENYFILENYEEAVTWFKKAVELEPDNGAFLDSLGWAYYLKKDYRKAENLLTRAASHAPVPDAG